MRRYANLMIVMLLGGLWHGAGWTFVIWVGKALGACVRARSSPWAFRRFHRVPGVHVAHWRIPLFPVLAVPRWTNPARRYLLIVLAPILALLEERRPEMVVIGFSRVLADGRVGWDLYRDRLTDGDPPAADGAVMLGLQAITLRHGYRSDGSLFRGGLIYRAHGANRAFGNTLAHIAGDQGQFRLGDRIDEDRVEALRATVTLLRGAGVTVVTYLPPVAPTVRQAMDAHADRFSYLEDARQAFASLGSVHPGAWDGMVPVESDCEFFDGSHQSETVDLRLLLVPADRRTAF